MAERGITGELADEIFDKMAAFANFGFPESHSVSFAYLVYASSWIKLHYPGAFLAALLNAQPMGFYSPNTLVADARRHGVTVHGPDINRSDWQATIEPPGTTVQLGLEYVRNLGEDMAKVIAAARPYASMEDLRQLIKGTTPVDLMNQVRDSVARAMPEFAEKAGITPKPSRQWKSTTNCGVNDASRPSAGMPTMMHPTATPGMASGSVTRRKVRRGFAPRSFAASISA